MNCERCGQLLLRDMEGDTFCPSCGRRTFADPEPRRLVRRIPRRPAVRARVPLHTVQMSLGVL